MKRYLIYKHWLKETYTTDEIDKQILLDTKNGMVEGIFDLDNKTYFYAKENKWVAIKKE